MYRYDDETDTVRNNENFKKLMTNLGNCIIFN